MGGRETIPSQEIRDWLKKRPGRTVADFVVIERPK
jgi:hypothetical protein